MERIAGFEPALLVWKTNVLTVEHYIRMVASRGFEPRPVGFQATVLPKYTYLPCTTSLTDW